MSRHLNWNMVWIKIKHDTTPFDQEFIILNNRIRKTGILTNRLNKNIWTITAHSSQILNHRTEITEIISAIHYSFSHQNLTLLTSRSCTLLLSPKRSLHTSPLPKTQTSSISHPRFQLMTLLSFHWESKNNWTLYVFSPSAPAVWLFSCGLPSLTSLRMGGACWLSVLHPMPLALQTFL